MTFSVEAHLPGSIWDVKRAPNAISAHSLVRRFRRRQGWRFIVIRDRENRVLAAWIKVSVPFSRWRLLHGRAWLQRKRHDER